MARQYHQGKYKPKNVHKYQGDPTDIVYRSSWECRAFKWLDEHPMCIAWGSETVVVPYISPVDGKQHRYFIDLKATFKYNDGSKRTFLIEIKPKSQTVPSTAKRQKQLLEETMTFAVNTSKWEAAKKYANAHGWTFVVITEDNLGIK